MRRMLPLLLLSVAWTTPLAQPGDVSFFVGVPGGTGNVQSSDELDPSSIQSPAALQGIRLLPIDFVGRTQSTMLLRSSPRLYTDVAGGRIRLPERQGGLYRYRRDEPGQSVFGYLWVDPGGTAQSVFERPGTGPQLDVDPLPFPVGIAASGEAILFGTSLAAGGDLWEVVLTSGQATNRTSAFAALDFLPGGFSLQPIWGAAAHTSGVVRFDRGAGAQVEGLIFPGSPAHFQGDLVASADGSTVATEAGSAADALSVFAFGATGSVVRLTATEEPLAGAGFLPAAESGPHLALAPDGSMCAWKGRVGLANEIFSTRIQSLGASTQVTGDAIFVDTLDDAGVITFIAPGSMVVVVGEVDGPTIDGADLYRFDFDANGTLTAQTNLTLTSGHTTTPFGAGGEIKTEGGLYYLDGFDGHLIYNDISGNDGELLSVPWDGSGPTVHLELVRDVNFIERVGDHVVLSMLRADPIDKRNLVRLPVDLSAGPTVMISIEPGYFFRDPVSTETGFLGALVNLPGGGQWLMRTFVPTGATRALLKVPFAWRTPLAFTPSAALGASTTLPSTLPVTGLWHLPLGLTLVPNGFQVGHLLPGA